MQVMRVFSQHLVYLLLKAQALALLALGKRARALSRFDRMLALMPADRLALASRAHLLVQLNRLDESLVSLRQLTAIAGSSAQLGAAWFNLGYVLQQKGRHEEACTAFESAIGHSPGMDRAWYGLGLALIQVGQLHGAKNALKQATVLQPMAPHGWYRLAQVELALGMPEQALGVLEHLRQFEPSVGEELKRDIERHVSLANHERLAQVHQNAC